MKVLSPSFKLYSKNKDDIQRQICRILLGENLAISMKGLSSESNKKCAQTSIQHLYSKMYSNITHNSEEKQKSTTAIMPMEYYAGIKNHVFKEYVMTQKKCL